MTQQVSNALSAQAKEAQRKIEDATQIALQMQRDVQYISTMAREAERTAKKTIVDMEEQIKYMAQRLAEQCLQAKRQLQAARLEQ